MGLNVDDLLGAYDNHPALKIWLDKGYEHPDSIYKKILADDYRWKPEESHNYELRDEDIIELEPNKRPGNFNDPPHPLTRRYFNEWYDHWLWFKRGFEAGQGS